MKKFHTGDRVRVIQERDMEGTVTGRNKHGHVVVEMTDGFERPFPDKELALVHSASEQAAFAPAATAVTRAAAGPAKAAEARPGAGNGQPLAAPAAPARKGIFLGLTAPIVGTQAREWYLLNNSDLALALVAGYNRDGRYQTDKVLVAPAKSATLLAEVPGRLLADRPTFQVWAHAAAPGQGTHPAPIHTAWHLPADFADRPLEPAPVLGKPMLFTELQAPGLQAAPAEPRIIGALPGGKLVVAGPHKAPTPALTGKAIAEAMMAPKAPEPPKAPATRPPGEVDLHIEQLSARAAELSSDEILQTQLRAFEQALEQAQASGQTYLVLVHGVTNTALRQAIHRRLSAAAQNGLIAHFEDFQKERLGYGATRVKLN